MDMPQPGPAHAQFARVVFRPHGVMMPDPADGDVLHLAKRTPRGEARHAYRAEGARLGFAVETRLPGQDAFGALLTGAYRRRAD
ncbi:MAG: hypothetical protein ABFC67_00725 [Mizugakiibacter sp.]|uniref:hypothetical protein n=1 Tax=Mizugakiibacter sp. TaxID=1972610 RepID=UPI0031C0D7C6|nr:hypothetical protein [Xanthomonadaceae bacterium]